MHPFDPTDKGFATLAVRAGQARGIEGEHAEPIYATSSFVFRDAAQAAARFSETEPGNIYSRFTNPTVRCFEERLAALEGGAACVATASGMGAILSMLMALLKSGDHIVCSDSVFGSTITLLNRFFAKFGVTTTYVSPDPPENWRGAIRPNTRLIYVETPSNPLAGIADIRAIAAIAREAGCLFAVDNCFCTPALQKPFELGAHLVIHSATKYLDGHGRCVGGAVVGDRELVGREVFGFMYPRPRCRDRRSRRVLMVVRQMAWSATGYCRSSSLFSGVVLGGAAVPLDAKSLLNRRELRRAPAHETPTVWLDLIARRHANSASQAIRGPAQPDHGLAVGDVTIESACQSLFERNPAAFEHFGSFRRGTALFELPCEKEVNHLSEHTGGADDDSKRVPLERADARFLDQLALRGSEWRFARIEFSPR